jgi:anaerobic selenocysteine-containing dehydrogenase
MSFSRRDFLKAAGHGLALTAIAAENAPSVAAAIDAPVASLPRPIARESAQFIINGKTLSAYYETRTTL